MSILSMSHFLDTIKLEKCLFYFINPKIIYPCASVLRSFQKVNKFPAATLLVMAIGNAHFIHNKQETHPTLCIINDGHAPPDKKLSKKHI